MTRYPDCESCAFRGVEEAICDECDDGDQWEDESGADMVLDVKPMKFSPTRKAA